MTITKQSLKMIWLIFVDDTNLALGKLNIRITNIDRGNFDIQKAIDWWEGYLKFMGSVIRHNKSFAYIINFNFKANEDFRFIPANQLEVELRVRDKFNVNQ